MYLESSRGCCGLFELYGFEDNFEENFRSAMLRGARWSAFGFAEAIPAIFATTIPSQREAIRGLKKVGFKRIETFKNPRSGNRVTLWLRLPGKNPALVVEDEKGSQNECRD